MVANGYFAHEGRNGSRPADRIRSTGYLSRGGAWRIGENLAWGTGELSTPRSIMAAWMHSHGHRANILLPAYREIGFGVIAGNPQRTRRLGRDVRHRVRRRPAARPPRRAPQRRPPGLARPPRLASAKRRSASRRARKHKSRMRARRSRARRARIALAPRLAQGPPRRHIQRTRAGLG